MKPWDAPKYRARRKAKLERRVRKVYGDKAVDEWERILKAKGLWRD